MQTYEKKTLDYYINLKCQEPIDPENEQKSQNSPEDFDSSSPKRSLSWLKYAFTSMLAFWIFNYITAIYAKDTLTAKVTNSFFIGVYLMAYNLTSKGKGPQVKDGYVDNIAKACSYLCGALNFLGNFMIFSAYDEATRSGQNVGIVTAIC
jgi:hypothetical protein